VTQPPDTGPEPARLDHDSLLIANTIELLAGGVRSDHPDCPGAIFQLQPGFDTGAPQPSADVVTKILTGGSRPHGRWADNRTVKLPVLIRGPSRAVIVAARELLAQLCDQEAYEVRWQRAGTPGPMVLDAYRAGPAVPAYSIIEERQDYCRVEITFAAQPYGRSDQRADLWFPSQAVGGPPAPQYHPWELIDQYAQVPGDPNFGGPGPDPPPQPGAWNRKDRPGAGDIWQWSAHWSPTRGYETPLYHRAFTNPPGDQADAMVDLTGRQHLNVWVGLGNSNGQWRGGNLTFTFTLYDDAGQVVQFGGTYWLAASDNWDRPNFTRISVPFPGGAAWGPVLREYIVAVPNFTASARMGDLYLHLMGAAPAADAWPAEDRPPSPRGHVYLLRPLGTARTPVSLRAQTPAGLYYDTVTLNNDQPTYPPGQPPSGLPGGWAPPPDLVSAPDGTPDAAQIRVFGAGGASGSILNVASLSGGGGGAGAAGDDHYPLTRSAGPGTPFVPVTPVIIGRGGVPQALPGQGQPPPGGPSQFGPLPGPGVRATGGDTPRTNSNGTAWNAGPGVGTDGPIRYSGGWSGVPVWPGGANQGAGGGGGGAGAAGNGGTGGGSTAPYGQPGGAGGLGGGGHGAGGRSPFVNGQTDSNAGKPGGGAGGSNRQQGGNGQMLGKPGADGRITVTYVKSLLRVRSVLWHMPNPSSDATFVPVINLGDGEFPSRPEGPPELVAPWWPVPSPHPGVPVRYSGTYAVAVAARTWQVTGDPARNIVLYIEQRSTATPGVVIGAATLTRIGVVPGDNWVTARGLVIMGTVPLPLKWVPPGNQDTWYQVRVTSTSWDDRFMDLLVLDVTGQTIGLVDTGTGYSTWYADEPGTDQSMGAVLGSDFGRASAVSVTDKLVAPSGGPFMLEPGTENQLLVYGADAVELDPQGNPVWEPLSVGADYWPRWWFDRADDRWAPQPAAGEDDTLPRRIPPPAARVVPQRPRLAAAGGPVSARGPR
jgi:hypothetical protein